MSTGATIVSMTPMKKVTQWYWVCQRAACKHEWLAKDINVEPKRCAKCKRLDWNRPTMAIGRPRKRVPKPRSKRRSK